MSLNVGICLENKGAGGLQPQELPGVVPEWKLKQKLGKQKSGGAA